MKEVWQCYDPDTRKARNSDQADWTPKAVRRSVLSQFIAGCDMTALFGESSAREIAGLQVDKTPECRLLRRMTTGRRAYDCH